MIKTIGIAATMAVFHIASGSASGAKLFIDPMFDVTIQEDIVFGTGSTGNPATGEIPLALDVFTPVGAEFTRPGILLLYGGGFETRDLDQLRPVAQEFASRGWVAATGDYRIVSDDPTWEPGPWSPQSNPIARAGNAAFNDAGKALAWMNDNSEQLGIDPERIVIGGASSGAIVSLTEGFRNNSAAAIVSLCGGMYGFESLIGPDAPPVALVHSRGDSTVAYPLAEAVVRRAESLGVPNALLSFDDAGHCKFLSDPGQGPQTIAFLNGFLYDQLELAAIPEPSTFALSLAAFLTVLSCSRRRSMATLGLPSR
jgi:acetyl esterase/lipase